MVAMVVMVVVLSGGSVVVCAAMVVGRGDTVTVMSLVVDDRALLARHP